MASPPGQAGTPRAAGPYAARFRAGDLRRVRRAVAEWAAQAGLRGQRAGDFVIAVHEIATNAVRHGSRLARLGLQMAGETAVQAEIRDNGHWPLGASPVPGSRRGRDGPAGGAAGL